MCRNKNHIVRSGFKEQWRRRFESYARYQDGDAGIAGWSETGLQIRLRFFLGHWQAVGSGKVWLDAGCGAGTYSRSLRDAGKQVLGLDYSHPTLLKARDRNGEGAPIYWVLGDATSLPFQDKQLDGALAFGVSQALPDSRKLVAELLRVTASGGEVWIDGLNRFCLPHLWEIGKRRLLGWPDHLRYESPARMQSLLRAAGAENTDIIWMPMLPSRWYRLQHWVEQAQFLFQIPVVSHLLCHSFLIRAIKRAPTSESVGKEGSG